jgi:hypothetical protein
MDDPAYEAMASFYGPHNGSRCPNGAAHRFDGKERIQGGHFLPDLFGEGGTEKMQESNWPQLGCGNRFFQEKRGEAKVVEYLGQRDGLWHNFVAAVMPEVLDDAIKGADLKFFQELNRCTADEILTAIPHTHPKTNLIHECIPGVSRFPVDDWLRQGNPVMTKAGWMLLAMCAYRRNPEALQQLASIFDPALLNNDVDWDREVMAEMMQQMDRGYEHPLAQPPAPVLEEC